MTNLKEEISSYNTNDIMSFFSNNKVLVAALAGVAAGIAIAAILGSDQAKKAYNTLSDTASDLSDKAVETWDSSKEKVKEAAQNVVGKAKSTTSRAKAGVE